MVVRGVVLDGWGVGGPWWGWLLLRFMCWCFASEGPCLPSLWVHLLGFYAFGPGCVGLLSHNII